MGDLKENELGGGVPVKFRGIDINGKSISSTIEEVVKAVPIVTPSNNGLMPSGGFIYRGRLISNTDFNDVGLSGWYFNTIGNGSGNSNFPDLWGVLIVFRTEADYIFQIHVSYEGLIKTRNHWLSWTPWKTLTFT